MGCHLAEELDRESLDEHYVIVGARHHPRERKSTNKRVVEEPHLHFVDVE